MVKAADRIPLTGPRPAAGKREDGAMEDAVTAQARERVTRWIEESRELLALLPGLLAAEHKSEQAERDTDRLRKDAEALRKEIGDLRKENLELKKGHDD